MLIRNAAVFTDRNEFKVLDIRTEGQRIRKVGAELTPEPGEAVIDGANLMAIPGLVDIHFHGAVGHDFCDADPEGLKAIAAYEASRGVLAICPATMTYSEEILNGVMDNARRFREEQDAGCFASLVGINLEGPFISPDKIGAQNPKYLMKPDVAMFRRLQERSGGLIKLVDLAPEVEGAEKFIEECKDEVTISIAHTTADYDTVCRAFAAGVHHMTHLYNAMPGLHHRNPGPIAAGIEYGAEAELIADNIHVHPAMVRLAFRNFGAERMILIADSMEATGLADGQYSLGGQAVTKRGNLAVLTEQPGTIAGSVTDLFGCVKTAVEISRIPMENALRAATINPARSIGIDADYGSITIGKYANIVLIDREWNIRSIINRGQVISSPSGSQRS